jgi:5-deoxy-D-glucuronate isomerase
MVSVKTEGTARSAAAASSSARRTPDISRAATAHPVPTPSEIGVASAPGKGRSPARLIGRNDEGALLAARASPRQPPDPPKTGRLSCWWWNRHAGRHSSSYPPHKHDTDNPPLESH